MTPVIEIIAQKAAAIVRRSDESMKVRVAIARAFAEALDGYEGFDLEQFFQDCFDADLDAGCYFHVEDDGSLYIAWNDNEEWQLVAPELTAHEAAALGELSEKGQP